MLAQVSIDLDTYQYHMREMTWLEEEMATAATAEEAQTEAAIFSALDDLKRALPL